ncbi:Integrase [Bacillus cytotoxicus]|nr:Integrase [Bacillus cytotoxicus]
MSDLLQLETQTIIKLKRKKRKEFKIKEGKTKKERMINLISVFDEVYSYAQTLDNTWLFPSRKGDKPISKIPAYRQLQKAGDVAMLQKILNHSTPQITLTYIGINKEAKDSVLDTFCI